MGLSISSHQTSLPYASLTSMQNTGISSKPADAGDSASISIGSSSIGSSSDVTLGGTQKKKNSLENAIAAMQLPLGTSLGGGPGCFFLVHLHHFRGGFPPVDSLYMPIRVNGSIAAKVAFARIESFRRNDASICRIVLSWAHAISQKKGGDGRFCLFSRSAVKATREIGTFRPIVLRLKAV